jgi:membrane-associated phospholipid phosphatase
VKDKKWFWRMMVVLVCVLMVVFWQVLAGYFWGSKLVAIDQLVNNWIVDIRWPFFNELMLLVTVVGNGWTILIGSLLGGLMLLISGRKKCFGALMLSVLAGLVFVNFSKYAIGRLRPPLENALIRVDGFSLPSGHSYFGTIFYGLMTYFLMKHFANWKKRIVIFLTGFGFILLLSFSRVYLGVHWVTDVVAGMATSLVWLGLIVTYLEKKQVYFSEKKEVEDIKIKGGICLLLVVWFLVVVRQFILVR